MACNLSCPFCLTPCGLSKESSLSALDEDLDALCEIYARSKIIGVGFSGGEPMLSPDRLFHCLSRLSSKRPDIYFWSYTNGLHLTKHLISALADAGLHELRFNMAATGYSHAHVTAMLRHSVTCLPSVTVEIPAIPEHAGLLREAVPAWSNAGVRYLNLHELIYEPGSPSEKMPGAREKCRMPDGHACEFNPYSSDLVADVLSDIDSGSLTISVNYCSLASKARQLRGRRRMMAALTLQPYEQLCMDDEAESVCYFNSTRCEFAHPDTLTDMERRAPWTGTAVVRRLLPLSATGPGQWTHFRILEQAIEL